MSKGKPLMLPSSIPDTVVVIPFICGIAAAISVTCAVCVLIREYKKARTHDDA